MRRKISAGFTIRKRLPIRVFGSTIYETIRIPISPVMAAAIMVIEYVFGAKQLTDNRKQIDDSEGDNNG